MVTSALPGTGTVLYVERVKPDAEVEWIRRNWTWNLPRLKGLLWQMGLSWGRRGGWVTGRKNWMNFRVDLSLTQTGWSSRQMWRREVPWRERHFQAGEQWLEWKGDGPCSDQLPWGEQSWGTEREAVYLDYDFSDGKRTKENDVAEQGLTVGGIWRSLLGLQRMLWSDCTWISGLLSSACNPTAHRISTYRENKWYPSCPYDCLLVMDAMI